MRGGLIVLLATTGALLWWWRADSTEPEREELRREAAEPQTKESEPPDPPPTPRQQAPKPKVTRAEIDELRRKVAGDTRETMEALEKIAKIGPEAVDAIPEVAARLIAFAKYKQEYKRANPMTHVSWIHVDFRAGDALTAIGEASIPTLIELLGNEYRDVRYTAQRALTELAPKSVPALIDATRDPDATRRAAAAETLNVAAKTHPEVFGVLAALLTDPERDVRRAAMKSPVRSRAVPTQRAPR